MVDGITDLMDIIIMDRDDDGQGSLACCSPWGHKESDTTEQVNTMCTGCASVCTSRGCMGQGGLGCVAFCVCRGGA